MVARCLISAVGQRVFLSNAVSFSLTPIALPPLQQVVHRCLDTIVAAENVLMFLGGQITLIVEKSDKTGGIYMR